MATIADVYRRECLCGRSAYGGRHRRRAAGLQVDGPMVCLATAHPAKFPESVDAAIGKPLARHPRLDALEGAPNRRTVMPARVGRGEGVSSPRTRVGLALACVRSRRSPSGMSFRRCTVRVAGGACALRAVQVDPDRRDSEFGRALNVVHRIVADVDHLTSPRSPRVPLPRWNICGAGFARADIGCRKREAKESVQPEPRDVGIAVRQCAELVTLCKSFEYVERVVEKR